jgi:hypothetical protein
LGIHLALLTASSEQALSDKGKPAVRLGRKATDQASRLMAGLPKKEAGLTTPLRIETSQPSILGEVYVPEGRIDRA